MKKPNILFLMCDQLQADVIDPESPCITPNIDYLSSIGMTFSRAYAPNPVCSPSRASLMTGLLPHNHGVLCVTHNVDDDQAVLREDKPHWAQRLVQSGYKTGYFGKWHVERSHKLEKYGWQSSVDDHSSIYRNKRNDMTNTEEVSQNHILEKYHTNPQGYKTSLFYGVTNVKPEKRFMGITTDLALDFLDEAKKEDKPWCCFVSVVEPHDPYICGKDAFDLYDVDKIKLPENVFDNLEKRPNLYKRAANYFKQFSKEELKIARACYYGSVTEIDSQFDRLIKKVKEMGQHDNTIIILTSDHGDMLGAHGLFCKNIGAFEEAYRVPLIISGPKIEKGAVTNARVGLHDLCQTILELTGCEKIDTLDSQSFANVCYNHKAYQNEFQKGFAEYYGSRIWLTQRVVWDGQSKYVFNGFDYDELYNLEDDPYEMENLIDDPNHKEKARQLCGYMWEVVKKTNDHCLYNTNYPTFRLAPYGPKIIDLND